MPGSQGTQAWDRYAYVNNSPVNFSDPSGNYLIDNQYAPPLTPTPDPPSVPITTNDSQTPVPFDTSNENPEIVSTITPPPPQGWEPTDIGWIEYIDKGDLFLDSAGVFLDIITAGGGGRVINFLQMANTAVDQTDLTVGVIQTIQDTAHKETDWYTYASVTTDAVGIDVPILADVFGILLNVMHAKQLYSSSKDQN